jgi:hypothetical protein
MRSRRPQIFDSGRTGARAGAQEDERTRCALVPRRNGMGGARWPTETRWASTVIPPRSTGTAGPWTSKPSSMGCGKRLVCWWSLFAFAHADPLGLQPFDLKEDAECTGKRRRFPQRFINMSCMSGAHPRVRRAVSCSWPRPCSPLTSACVRIASDVTRISHDLLLQDAR